MSAIYLCSGSQFKIEYPDSKLIKLTTHDCIHNGYEFKSGLNVDSKPFGRFRVLKLDQWPKWVGYNGKTMFWCWDVEIPDDAVVCLSDDEIECDHFILSNKRPIHKLDGFWEQAPEILRTSNYLEELDVDDPALELKLLELVANDEHERALPLILFQFSWNNIQDLRKLIGECGKAYRNPTLFDTWACFLAANVDNLEYVKNVMERERVACTDKEERYLRKVLCKHFLVEKAETLSVTELLDAAIEQQKEFPMIATKIEAV